MVTWTWPSCHELPDGGLRAVLLGVMLRLRREKANEYLSIPYITAECVDFTGFPYSQDAVVAMLIELKKAYNITYNNEPLSQHGWRLERK